MTTTTTAAPTIAELVAAPVGTTIQADGEALFVSADRSDMPWLAVSDSFEPDSQQWYNCADLIRYGLRGGETIVYPANYVAPDPVANIVTIWHPHGGASQGYASTVDDRTCRHTHRTLEAAGKCAITRVKRIKRERAAR